MKQWDNTEEWNNYQSGLDFNNRLNLYAKTDLYWNFYNDKHWEGINANGLPKFTLNIGKQAINYFIASITSQKIKQQFSVENLPDEPDTEEDIETKQFIQYLNGYLDIKWDTEKMDSKVKQIILDAAVSGDMCLHVYWDKDIETGQDEKGDFCIETIDNVNVMLGNPNTPDIERQPYILIVGREVVSKLKEEAKKNGISQDLIDSITFDSDYDYQAGSQAKVELNAKGDDGKCLYLIKYWKKDGTVYWNKSTRYCPIRKDVDLGINKYPVAFNNWFKVKNCFHGSPVMAGVIDNQIVINQLFALVAYWMRFNAFGKVIFDQTKIASWSNALGKAIAANGDVTGIVQQLRSGDFNNGILEVINLAIKYTKEVIGANDAFLGNVKPENTSAIIAVSKQSSIPLQNPQDNLYRLIDDLTLIEGEFILKKYRERKISYKENSKTMVTTINTEKFRNLLLRAKTDVGPSNYWSEITCLQTLDNLLINKAIDVVQYLERIPEGIIPKRQELIEELKQQMEQAQIQQQQQMEYEQMAKFVDSLPGEQQAQLEQIRQTDPQQYELVIRQLMGNNQSVDTAQTI